MPEGLELKTEGITFNYSDVIRNILGGEKEDEKSCFLNADSVRDTGIELQKRDIDIGDIDSEPIKL